jgi:hypothetical protein
MLQNVARRRRNAPGLSLVVGSERAMSSVAERIGQHLRSVDSDAAGFAARKIVAASEASDRIRTTPARTPTQLEWMATAYHETAHAVAAWSFGATVLELRLREEDATGLCRITEIKEPFDRIVFALAGIIAEAKYNPAAIHRYGDASYDLLVARMLIDSWNERGVWPHLTCDNAAKKAVRFVEAQWQAIEDVALALGDSGELEHDAVRIFATCRAECNYASVNILRKS